MPISVEIFGLKKSFLWLSEVSDWRAKLEASQGQGHPSPCFRCCGDAYVPGSQSKVKRLRPGARQPWVV